MKEMIVADHITYSYSGVPVIRDASFVVEQGEYIAFTGSNGSGKSTMLKLLLGVLPLQQGTVRLVGQPVKEFNQWSKIGYLPQNAGAVTVGFPANALEIVTANLYSRIGRFRLPGKQAKEQALAALESVGMAEYVARRPDELSGGQLQRVLLARALVNQPELLILDEPTAGVDTDSIQSFYQLLTKLHQSGITILMVTHDMNRVVSLVQRSLCLEEGSLVSVSKNQMELEQSVKHSHVHRVDGAVCGGKQ